MPEPLNHRADTTPERLAETLEKPELDNRTYRVIRLPNKLEALLIHDAETDKASAALDVNVGAFSDSEDMPGIAHAVEHLLFMGTEKYPVENEYSSYLSANSGYSNAYTASTSTNYYFEVGASGAPSNSRTSTPNGTTDDSSTPNNRSPLYGALDRFAQFFIAPLFLEETLDRELRAVDSENKKNLQSDLWRLHQLSKNLSNPDHPYHTFSTGNLDTLKNDPLKRGVKIRDAFIKHYQKHYSANLMKLVVLGKESLDELESWVSELFSEVPNKNLPQNRWDGISPLTGKELGTQIFAKPVMDSRSLDLYFPYPDEESLYESQPSRYLSHLIGHEGPGSILSLLKSKGWANDLSSGSMSICPGAAFFTVSIKLTKDGLLHYKDIVKVIFQYISLLREEPPKKWIHDEMKEMTEVEFRFRQKTPASSTTSKLSPIMQKPYPRDRLLSAQHVLRKFDGEAIINGLAHLRPDNFRIMVVSQDFPGNWDQKERWYGTEYKNEKIPQDFLSELEAAVRSTTHDRPSELHLPHKNEFIPTRLEVERKDTPEPTKYPKLIRRDLNVRTWFKKDDQFWVPKATLEITLRTPLTFTTPMNVMLSNLYRELVTDALSEYGYDAEIAGLRYDIMTHYLGLDITVSGYNDKLSVLLEKVLLQMRDLEVKDERFKVIHERVTRGFKNWYYGSPYAQSGHYSRWLIQESAWTNEQYLEELPNITADDVRQFYPLLIRQFHIEVLAHGNLYREDALRYTNLVEKILKPRPLPSSQFPIRRSVVLPAGSNYVYERTLTDPANINHCIEYFVFVSSNLDRVTRAKLLLLGQLADEPVFDTLRTKEQLGYIVFSSAIVQGMTAGWKILVQSEKPPEHLEGRIEAFLTTFEKTLEDMKDDVFDGYKVSLVNKKLEKLKNLGQETGRFWTHITNEFFDFEQVDEDVVHIQPLTKPEILDFYRYYIAPSSPHRAKASIYLRAQASASDIPPLEHKAQVLSRIAQLLKPIGDIDEKKLSERFAKVDMFSGNQAPITEALSAFLEKDVGMMKDEVEKIVEQGKEFWRQLLGTAGTKPNGEAAYLNGNGTANGVAANGETGVKSKTTTPEKITDVWAWKAGMAVSRGARPVKDLSEYEELESKL
ncbi:MAG: Insulinase (Peptidase M16) [Bogoriella megaspora]|nr:MAG: Insulinase (Peptidase M16) [Bogoriella megaspora]